MTGASGALNGATVDHLLQRQPVEEVVVAVRDPAKARRFADAGVAVRHADYADPSSLPSAFAGADQLLLVSHNDRNASGIGLHQAAIDAAVDADVGRVLYTSHQGAAPDSPFPPARDHFATEQLLAASGLPWTSLRNGFYAHSIDWLAGPWRETGVIAVPGDGPVSWTARSDAAEGAAAILLSDQSYDGPVTLTAAEAPTFGDVARLASEVSGREITRVIMDPDEWTAAQVAAGRPAFLAFYRAAEQGFFASTDPLLAELLGRPPASVEELISGSR